MAESVIRELNLADQQAERIKDLEEQCKRQQRELLEYIRAEQVMIAAGIVTEQKAKQAHDIVRDLK